VKVPPSDPSISGSWFVPSQPNSDNGPRLFIFPYAGGGPAAFSKWSVEGIGIWTAHYPGRGSRYNEHLIKELRILVERILQAIQPVLDKPFAFYGHSMGGLVAFELTRQLRRQDLPQPQLLFISACGAPQMPDPHPPIHALPEAEFIDSLKKLNGIPPEILQNSEAMNILLPTARADFEAVETYQYVSNGSPIDPPILTFGGLDDPRVSRERLEGWATQTSSRFKSQYFPGDHFFINTSRQAVIEAISAEIKF